MVKCINPQGCWWGMPDSVLPPWAADWGAGEDLLCQVRLSFVVGVPATVHTHAWTIPAMFRVMTKTGRW